MNITSPKTYLMGLSDSEDCVILAGLVLSQYQHVTDGQTDRLTDAAMAMTIQRCITLAKLQTG